MSIENLSVLKESSAISRMIMPLGEAELEKLEKEVLESPQSRTIQIWDEFHLSDKQRYEACQRNGLAVNVKKMYFKNITAAAFYVCGKEIKREDLTQMYKKYLIGQFHILTVEMTNAAKLYVANRIAKDFYIAAGTVLKYAASSAAINLIFNKNAELGFFILTEKTRISLENIIELSRLRPEELNAISNTIVNEKIEHVSLDFIRREAKYSHTHTKEIKSRREKKEERLIQHASIRQMPEYNPDAEVNSLCMTVDSWVSTINRVSNSENFCKITPKASLQLMKKLTILEQATHTVQERLVERNNE